ncbi:MAG: hypothetical protein AAB553_03850 [Patescibacteria group bacterium]
MEYKRVFWGQKSLRFWYLRYKDSPLYAGAVFGVISTVSLILLIFLVIPQIQSWFSLREQVVQMEQKIAVLRNNTTYLQSVDRAQVQKQLDISLAALPWDKQVDSILQAINNASITSGVGLGDFAFQIGNVSTLAASVTSDPETRGLNTTRVNISVTGSLARVQKFLETLQKSLPLSEVISAEGTSQSTNILMQFYQKPLPSLSFKPDKPIVPVSAQDTALLNQLSEWKVPIVPDQVIESSNAAIPLF